MDYKDIDFVAENYRDGIFSPEMGWRMLKPRLGIRRRRIGIAAAVAAVMALTASAAVFMHYRESKPDTPIPVTVLKDSQEEAFETPKTIVFENTNLTEVVATLETEFDVTIGNLPQNAEEYVLTLRFEGTIEELVSAINETLGIQLSIEE